MNNHLALWVAAPETKRENRNKPTTLFRRDFQVLSRGQREALTFYTCWARIAYTPRSTLFSHLRKTGISFLPANTTFTMPCIFQAREGNKPCEHPSIGIVTFNLGKCTVSYWCASLDHRKTSSPSQRYATAWQHPSSVRRNSRSVVFAKRLPKELDVQQAQPQGNTRTLTSPPPSLCTGSYSKLDNGWLAPLVAPHS